MSIRFVDSSEIGYFSSSDKNHLRQAHMLCSVCAPSKKNSLEPCLTVWDLPGQLTNLRPTASLHSKWKALQESKMGVLDSPVGGARVKKNLASCSAKEAFSA